MASWREDMRRESNAGAHAAGDSDPHRGLLLFAGLIAIVGANVLLARRYMARIKASIKPSHMRVGEEAINDYWSSEASKARWDAYYAAQEAEAKEKLRRLNEWVQSQRETAEWKERMRRYYQQRAYEAFFGSGQRGAEEEEEEEGAWDYEAGAYRRGGRRDLRWERAKTVLGLAHVSDRELTVDLIKRAFRKAALSLHPDTARGEGEGGRERVERFQEASDASKYLLDKLQGKQGWEDDDDY